MSLHKDRGKLFIPLLQVHLIERVPVCLSWTVLSLNLDLNRLRFSSEDKQYLRRRVIVYKIIIVVVCMVNRILCYVGLLVLLLSLTI